MCEEQRQCRPLAVGHWPLASGLGAEAKRAHRGPLGSTFMANGRGIARERFLADPWRSHLWRVGQRFLADPWRSQLWRGKPGKGIARMPREASDQAAEGAPCGGGEQAESSDRGGGRRRRLAKTARIIPGARSSKRSWPEVRWLPSAYPHSPSGLACSPKERYSPNGCPPSPSPQHWAAARPPSAPGPVRSPLAARRRDQRTNHPEDDAVAPEQHGSRLLVRGSKAGHGCDRTSASAPGFSSHTSAATTLARESCPTTYRR